jgi:hypothetical protein
MLAEQSELLIITHGKSSNFMVARTHIFCQAKTPRGCRLEMREQSNTALASLSFVLLLRALAPRQFHQEGMQLRVAREQLAVCMARRYTCRWSFLVRYERFISLREILELV